MPGTTGSSGLNNLLESSQQVQTTLPSWYDTAQQNIVNQAGTAMGATPQFQNTTAQQAVNTLQGPNNPFTQAQGSLNTIASGAANPWIVDQSTGQVTPNVNTAMGGLFAAQQQQMNQMLPTMSAPSQATGVGTGGFGGLRAQTAVDTARANALSQLQAQQMTAALQNQQTGAQAGGALGNVGQQGLAGALTTGSAQMSAPFQAIGNYANLVNSINVPGTVTQQTQESPLQMMGTLSSVPSAAGNLLSSLGIGKSALSGLGSGLTNWFNSLGGSNNLTGNLINGASFSSGPNGLTVTQADGTILSGNDALNAIAQGYNAPDGESAGS